MMAGQQQPTEVMEDGTVRSPRWRQEVWNRQQHLLTLNFAERVVAYEEVDEQEDNEQEASDRFAACTPQATTPRSPTSSPRDRKKKRKPLRMKDVMGRPSNKKSARDQDEEARNRRLRREADVEAKADRIMGQVLAYARLHHVWRASLPAQPERQA
jgi:hypothetical protein